MSFNPLSVILSQKKLIEENFTDWKRNLNIVLTSEKHKFVLLEACPPEPQQQGMRTAAEIMTSVQAIFGETSTRAQFEAVKAIMNSRMKLGTPVRDHLLRIMAHFNEAEIHGSSIDQQTQLRRRWAKQKRKLQRVESVSTVANKVTGRGTAKSTSIR
ncbi:hypothetical protein UlMin_020522 [Ulmus minor]